MRKAALLSIGCKTNQYEVEALKEQLVGNGFVLTDFDKDADVYIINTCTVTAEAARKSRQMIRRSQGKGALICVMGCLSELERYETAGLDDVRIIAGTGNRSQIVSFIDKALKDHRKYHIPSPKDTYENIGVSDFFDKSRALIKIEDGCDNECSFCIIPHARGGTRSRDLGDILDEAGRLSSNGYEEVVITGINICRYRSEGRGLVDVLKAVDRIEGIKRIRLGSVYPDFIGRETVEKLQEIKKLCPHFHISLQSGSTRILQAMNRRYTSEQAYENLKRLAATNDDILFTTDVIVGFPGEDEKDFLDTYDMISKLPFYHTHVFKYSPRMGTKAAKMKGQVDPKIKDERSRRLIALSKSKKRQIIEGYAGRTQNCLFESCTGHGSSDFVGHTDNYIDVICRCECIPEGISKVKITGYEDGYARSVFID